MSGHRWAGDVILLPLAEMVARIELARREEAAPTCPTCGSSTTTASLERRCCKCGESKPLEAFTRNRCKPFGRGYTCKPCNRARWARYDIERRRRQFRAILEGAAS
jgi:hypothetical protein